VINQRNTWVLRDCVGLPSEAGQAGISPQDKHTLRELARHVAELAAMPIMAERRDLWTRHNRLERVRPMILTFPEGSWSELLPVSALTCEGLRAKEIEWTLRSLIYYHTSLHDDTVIEREWVVNKHIATTGWGLEPKRTPSTQEGGAYGFLPVINAPSDLQKLHFPEVIYDPKGTQQELEEAHDLFDGILDVRLRGISRISYHLMAHYTSLRGLEQVMMDMLDNPNWLHDAMAFLEEGHHGILRQYQEQNLLSLGSDGSYQNSGGVAYSSELPQPDHDPAHVRPCDMWGSAEAQEMAQVSPRMHAKFILPYERRLLEPFGLTGYGCCEDLTNKLDDVLSIPNLRRISISPWADVDRCAEKLGGDYIYSWKPKPMHLVGDFDEEMLREYIGHTLHAAKDCVLEMVLKDTHTCENHPERFTRWADIARELIEAL